MQENKWVLLSRSLWATLLPIIGLILTTTGVTGAEGILGLSDTIFGGGIVIVAGVLEFLHQRNPQPTSIAK